MTFSEQPPQTVQLRGPDRLRLFVVGERSGNPDEWTMYCNRAYVVAYSPEQAAEMARSCAYGGIAEIEFDGPLVLSYEL